MKNYSKLMLRIGYEFRNTSLLELALSHRSVGNPNNERLEFLGDSILNIIISEELYVRFATATEGELTRMRSKLVCGETLASLAKKLEIGNSLILGTGERRTGGHQRRSILADTLESVIGAIFLDSDIATVKSIILDWYTDKFSSIDTSSIEKDAKTQLQELMQSRHIELPSYNILKVEGMQHEQTFHIACCVEGYEGIGISSSRRKAEQVAAKKVLTMLETE